MSDDIQPALFGEPDPAETAGFDDEVREVAIRKTRLRLAAALAKAIAESPLLPERVALKAGISERRLNQALLGRCDTLTTAEIFSLVHACGFRINFSLEAR